MLYSGRGKGAISIPRGLRIPSKRGSHGGALTPKERTSELDSMEESELSSIKRANGTSRMAFTLVELGVGANSSAARKTFFDGKKTYQIESLHRSRTDARQRAETAFIEEDKKSTHRKNAHSLVEKVDCAIDARRPSENRVPEERGIVFCDKHGNVKHIVEQEQKERVQRDLESTGGFWSTKTRTRNAPTRWKSSDYQQQEVKGARVTRQRKSDVSPATRMLTSTVKLLAQPGPYQATAPYL